MCRRSPTRKISCSNKNECNWSIVIRSKCHRSNSSLRTFSAKSLKPTTSSGNDSFRRWYLEVCFPCSWRWRSTASRNCQRWWRISSLKSRRRSFARCGTKRCLWWVDFSRWCERWRSAVQQDRVIGSFLIGERNPAAGFVPTFGPTWMFFDGTPREYTISGDQTSNTNIQKELAIPFSQKERPIFFVYRFSRDFRWNARFFSSTELSSSDSFASLTLPHPPIPICWNAPLIISEDHRDESEGETVSRDSRRWIPSDGSWSLSISCRVDARVKRHVGINWTARVSFIRHWPSISVFCRAIFDGIISTRNEHSEPSKNWTRSREFFNKWPSTLMNDTPIEWHFHSTRFRCRERRRNRWNNRRTPKCRSLSLVGHRRSRITHLQTIPSGLRNADVAVDIRIETRSIQRFVAPRRSRTQMKSFFCFNRSRLWTTM